MSCTHDNIRTRCAAARARDMVTGGAVHVLEVTATCDDCGAVLYPAEVEAEGLTVRAILVERTAQAVEA